MINNMYDAYDIAALLGLGDAISQHGDEVAFVCPECGDSEGRFSFKYNTGTKKDNTCHCFRCGYSGTALSLFMKHAEKDYAPNAYKDATRDIYSLLSSGKYAPSKPSENAVKKAAVKNATLRSDEDLNSVYRAVLLNSAKIPYREGELENMQKRGLTKADICKGLLLPTPDSGKLLARTLVAYGYNLEGVPGFYQRGQEWDWQSPQGYFCPVMLDGLVVGFQVRVDKPIGKAKYLWVSSADEENGCSPEARVSFLRGSEDNPVIITEGILKAYVTYSLLGREFTVIGVPGIQCLSRLSEALDKVKEGTTVILAYDMDKELASDDLLLLDAAYALADEAGMSIDEFLMKNGEEFKTVLKARRIRAAEEKLESLCKPYTSNIHSLKWDIDSDGVWNGNFKGIDDFLVGITADMRDKFKAYLKKL